MSGWSNEESLSFLEYYQVETSIWNPKDVYHKDKKKISDAWSRLSELMGKPVKELKAKKEILMTTFRKYLKKKQDSNRSGAGAEDIYKPTWFAYEIMESFLLPVYTCIDGLNTETQSQQNAVHEETEEAEDDSLLSYHSDTVTTPSRPSISTNKRRRLATETAEKQMATAFEQLTKDIRQRRSECRPAHEDDDCDLYAKLLAIKLRELPNDERKIIMYQIDGLFINRINQSSYEHVIHHPLNIILDLHQWPVHMYVIHHLLNSKSFRLRVGQHQLIPHIQNLSQTLKDFFHPCKPLIQSPSQI